MSCFGRRHFGDAKAAFARALAIVPDSPDVLFGIAQAHQENGESQAAADYFRRYLIVSPGDQTAWVRLGFCLPDARSTRCRPRLLPHGRAPRFKGIWQRAIVVGEVEPRPLLAQAERRCTISARK